MIKSLAYFLVAIALISVFKLIEVNFYHILKSPHPNDKKYKGDDIEATEDKVEEIDKLDEVMNAVEQDTISTDFDTTSNSEPIPEEDNQETEQAAEIVESNDESVPDQPVQSTAVSEDDFFNNLKNAYLSPILADLPEGRSREDVVVRYYKHEDDGNRMYSLRRLGYYLHEREAEDNIGMASNALYYGSDVDVRDIQLVAYTLLEAGMPLKAIRKSAYDWKYNSIEIGADASVQDNPVLKKSDIQSFRID